MAESGRETEGEEEDSGASDEYEYVTLTSAEVLEKLEEAWQNERFAPELLEHKTEVVDGVLEQIKEMQVSRPNMDSFVFARALERTEQVNVDPDDDDREPVDLEPNTQCLLKYHPISSLVQTGAVRLL